MTPYLVRLGGAGDQRPRHQVLGGVEFADQPLHVVGVGDAFFGVAGVAVARGAAGEERAFGRVRAGVGAIGDAVAVDVEVAAEFAAGFQFLGRHYLAAVVARLSSDASGRDSRWFIPISRSRWTFRLNSRK